MNEQTCPTDQTRPSCRSCTRFQTHCRLRLFSNPQLAESSPTSLRSGAVQPPRHTTMGFTHLRLFTLQPTSQSPSDLFRHDPPTFSQSCTRYTAKFLCLHFRGSSNCFCSGTGFLRPSPSCSCYQRRTYSPMCVPWDGIGLYVW